MDDEWLSKWFTEAGARPFITTSVVHFADKPNDASLKAVINLRDEDLKAFGKELLETERDPLGPLSDGLKELRWGFRAYHEFQDILTVTFSEVDIQNGASFESRYQQNYCYYESLVYLRESIAAWLDRNVLAALALLRPFLELAVFQVYWTVARSGESSERYHTWLKDDKRNPTFSQALADVFDLMPARQGVADRRYYALFEVLQSYYKALCAYHHVSRPNESMATKGGGIGNTSYQDFCYALFITNVCVRQVVFMYTLAYPLALFPVERYKKWPFAGPIGMYSDRWNLAVLEKYLGTSNVQRLRNLLTNMDEVGSKLEWYESFPNLTDEEIELDWQRFIAEAGDSIEATRIEERLADFKAHCRALGWALTYSTIDKEEEELPDDIADKRARYIRNW